RRGNCVNERCLIWGLNEMASIQAFTKILNHQDLLKSQALIAHQQAMNEFEVSAEKLYLLLKKKEEVEKEYNYYLSSSGTVTTLATHYAFIEQINQKIKQVQIEVNQKRAVMDKKQEKLTEAHVEVKKYEKIIEKKYLK